MIAVARRLKADRPRSLDRVAVVFRRPLPYLYLARAVFGAGRIPYQTQDGLPLAAEPIAAALDLLLAAASSHFTRGALIALLRSPYFSFAADGRLSRGAVAALDRGLSDARYLGELDKLRSIAAGWTTAEAAPTAAALPALNAALTVATLLEPLLQSRPMSAHITTILSIFEQFDRTSSPDDDALASRGRARPIDDRERARVACCGCAPRTTIRRWTIDELAVAVRRWIEDETFVPDSSERAASSCSTIRRRATATSTT